MYSMYRNLPTFNKSATKIALVEMLVSLSPSNKIDLVSATTTENTFCNTHWLATL